MQFVKELFHAVGVVFTAAGFMPKVGTAFSAASAGCAFGEKLAAENISDWYELAPEIQKLSVAKFRSGNQPLFMVNSECQR